MKLKNINKVIKTTTSYRPLLVKPPLHIDQPTTSYRPPHLLTKMNILNIFNRAGLILSTPPIIRLNTYRLNCRKSSPQGLVPVNRFIGTTGELQNGQRGKFATLANYSL